MNMGYIMKFATDARRDIAVIAPGTRFDFSTHREFRNAYETAMATPGVRAIHVDLKDVAYLDSSALGMLLLLKEKAEVHGQSVALVNSHGTVRDILDVANFNKLFSIS
ncbi:putative anti-sigma factor antagonist [mine drainage metagenome]|uniref:Putative anti-sigma factor antagonist n=1 Tax=mine drainage metagenome TaxID=410659 RepID=A0A1J5Q2E8_9ZZZZ